MIKKRALASFFAYAREREEIRLRREAGVPAPWTADPVLRRYRFCNVFREDDRVTRWFRDNVRKPRWRHPDVLMATVVFRWFNHVPTGEAIKHLFSKDWDRRAVEAVLRPRQKAGEQLFTGAYMIRGPHGVDKLTGVLDAMDVVWRRRDELFCMWDPTLERFHAKLCEMPFLGKFMAYEIVTDLRHTYLLTKANDIMTWASAGPGAARGLNWLTVGSPEGLGYQSEKAQVELLALMRQLLDASKDQKHWPWPGRPWEMREVEHTLCEFDKICRGRAGQPLKRRFDLR